MAHMKSGSRCGFVLDEGSLFRVNEIAFVQTKRKLLEECDLGCVLSLPTGTYASNTKDDILFFTKGKQTERIWYYDLSDVKIGKKSPMMLAHFEEFFRLLPERVESERSWTVDFATKLQTAIAEARPHREKAIEFSARAKKLEDEFVALRKTKTAPVEKLREHEERWKATLREARDSEAKAVAIENGVYDLKAVNPNRKTVEDMRTPSEIITVIDEKGCEVDAALGRLRTLLAANYLSPSH